MQAMALSKAPVIASHSAARALADHSRNMDDEQLEALKKNGGVIQTVAFASYVKIAQARFARARRGDRGAAQGVRPARAGRRRRRRRRRRRAAAASTR